MEEVKFILAAALGGVLPPLAWLWFWLHEDSLHPEPRRLIALAFFSGMVTVLFAIFAEKATASFMASQTIIPIAAASLMTVIIFAWSAIEEVFKYIAARVTVLWRREDDEPIDPVMYMVTVALGFAAAENTLFLLNPNLAGEQFLEIIQTGNLRFIGATLLHVLASAVVGVMLGIAFYKSRAMQALYTVLGLILATLLHAFFNFFILNTAEENLIRTFAAVWIGLIVLIAVLELIKRKVKRRYII